MTELRPSARHAASSAVSEAPDGVEPDEVWVPPPYEPTRPGDFVEFAATSFRVRRSHRGLAVLLCLLILAGLAFGDWWYFIRDDSSGNQALTCQEVYANMPPGLQNYLHVSDGGTLPKGIPVPRGTTGDRCSAATKNGPVLLVVWPDASEADYATLLGAGGWTSSRTVGDYTFYANGGDHREIATTTIHGQLIALYDR